MKKFKNQPNKTIKNAYIYHKSTIAKIFVVFFLNNLSSSTNLCLTSSFFINHFFSQQNYFFQIYFQELSPIQLSNEIKKISHHSKQNHIFIITNQIQLHKQTQIITLIDSFYSLMIQPRKNTPQSLKYTQQTSKANNQRIYHSAVKHITKSFSIQSFEKFFIRSQSNFDQLSLIIKECNLDDVNCRFNVWRLCLGVVSVNSTIQKKREEIAASRQTYQEKKDDALKSSNKKSPIKQPVKKNPLLMMSAPKVPESKQVQSDQFLKEQIHKDVERTYQEMKFFQQKSIQKLLSLILFVWCRRNTDVSYKQGMNELLASVVVCYFKQAEFKSKEDKPQNISGQLWQEHLHFNSVEHAQSDIYSVFEKIIDIQGDMYKTEADLTIKSKVNPNSKNNTPILQRIIQIKDHKLKHMDLELFRILKLQDVQTKSFMLRWIRCMHTRQFDLDNSFVIWDSIFLEFLQSENSKKNHQFQFIDAMCLSMFMYMRSIVFTKQTAGEILQIYQKYPALKRGAYLDELITLAWSICEELRNESQNVQPSQSNWFQDSSKVKALHFMQKKQEKKPSQQPVQNIQTKQQQPIRRQQVKKIKIQTLQKQLREAENKKPAQILKKHSQTTKKSKELSSQFNQIVKKEKEPQKSVIEKKNSQEAIKSISMDKQKSISAIQKQSIKELNKNFSLEETAKEPINSLKEEKYQKIAASNKKNSPIINKQSEIIKVPDNISISLSSLQISQVLQNLNQSLRTIRDVDAQSLIRKTIKKIEQKVKGAKDEDKQKNLEKKVAQIIQENGDGVQKDK